MKNRGFLGKSLFLSLVGALALGCAAQAAPVFPDPTIKGEPAGAAGLQTAVLAGGCFWGVEAVFEALKGVEEVVSGYAGGEASTARYEVVGNGTTGHAESVRILYNPAVISFGTLLKVYFSVAHNPTELNFQGPDHGTQYRSAIFYGNQDQKAAAEAYIAVLEKAHLFDRRIVTEVAPLKAFYPAEDYHQNFLVRHPTHPYIVYWDLPKMGELKATYPTLLK